MNRREMMSAAATAVATHVVASKVDAIDSEQRPMALVVTLPDGPWVTDKCLEMIAAQVKAAIPNCPPVLVIQAGMSIAPIYSSPPKLSDEDVDRLKKEIEAIYAGPNPAKMFTHRA